MTDPVSVTQEDREAAAETIVNRSIATDIRSGIMDDHPRVQAFARHRPTPDTHPAAAGSVREAAKPVAWRWERRGRFGDAIGEWERVITPYAPDTWPVDDRRNITPLYAAAPTPDAAASAPDYQRNVIAHAIGRSTGTYVLGRSPEWAYDAAHAVIAALAPVAAATVDPVREAAKPWADYHGDLPDYDHPLRPVYESGIQYAVELLAKELGVTEWVPCDGTEEFDGDLGGTLMNIVLAAMPEDEHGDPIHPRDLPALLAAPDAAASNVAVPGEGEWSLIERLRDEEADSVTILCDNPDGPPNAAVECCGFWTGFAERRFEGDTIRAALQAAVTAKNEAARTGYPDPAADPDAAASEAGEVERLREALRRCARRAEMQIEKCLQRSDGRGLNDAKSVHKAVTEIVRAALATRSPASTEAQQVDNG